MAGVESRYKVRPVGEKGLKSRGDLLTALKEHLEYTPWRSVSVKEIASMAKVSPATFWSYFESIEDAMHEVVAEYNRSGEKIPEHLHMICDLISYESEYCNG